MESKFSKANGHSAQVRMELHLDGQIFPIAQMGPDFFVLRQPIEHPPASAELTLRIDESETRWSVNLVDGITASHRKTRTTPLQSPIEALSQHTMVPSSDTSSASRGG